MMMRKRQWQDAARQVEHMYNSLADDAESEESPSSSSHVTPYYAILLQSLSYESDSDT